MHSVVAPMQGTIVTVEVTEGQSVPRGKALMIMESMKLEHVIEADEAGVVCLVSVAPGDMVTEGQILLTIEPGVVIDAEVEVMADVHLDYIRPDLAEVLSRQAVLLDSARPEAVAKRHRLNHRTARENVADLVDAGSFVEYGGLAIAAQRRRRPIADLIERTAADGMVGGIGRVNGELFNDDRARVAVLSYDYMVLAGTQGLQNHRKKDRLFELAEHLGLPVVFFAEGGGGRPGDTDGTGVSGLDCLAFMLWGRLSGRVPLVAIVAGRCFAGNAAIAGCADVIIATADTNLGMGGPAMIEGGGLGVFKPEEVGPMSVQTVNGVVDIAVDNEVEAVAVAKKYLSYFQGALTTWTAPDSRLLRSVIPENRLRVYDVRKVIELLADTDSVLELRPSFGLGMVTAFIRIEGRPIGVIANNPNHLAGAIETPGADKAARFLQLCDAFDIPVLSLVDTPGMMVGPEVEATALVRHCSRLFVTGASVTVPIIGLVLRKGYGLGAQAMVGGSFKTPVAMWSWPTGEFGGMGLEGSVRLGYRRELEAIADPVEREALFQQMVAKAYEHGKALNAASHFEIDDVIDPADSRRRIVEVLRALPPVHVRTTKKRPMIDTW